MAFHFSAEGAAQTTDQILHFQLKNIFLLISIFKFGLHKQIISNKSRETYQTFS